MCENVKCAEKEIKKQIWRQEGGRLVEVEYIRERKK